MKNNFHFTIVAATLLQITHSHSLPTDYYPITKFAVEQFNTLAQESCGTHFVIKKGGTPRYTTTVKLSVRQELAVMDLLLNKNNPDRENPVNLDIEITASGKTAILNLKSQIQALEQTLKNLDEQQQAAYSAANRTLDHQVYAGEDRVELDPWVITRDTTKLPYDDFTFTQCKESTPDNENETFVKKCTIHTQFPNFDTFAYFVNAAKKDQDNAV